MTSSDRRQKLKALFAEASELPLSDREAFLDRECPDELRSEVEELLSFDDGPGFLEPESDGVLDVPRAASMALPERLGKYRILREIGSGGMGRVFEAEQERPRRRVALKVMHALQPGGELAQRFEREAELLGRLEHPGIARIYEAGVDPVASVPFLAMELIQGKALLDHAEHAGLDDAQRLELLVRIAEPIAHAHHKGVIHRDLKPGNILVTADGQPKVLDFGIARASDGEDLQATRVGQVVGTVTHMSPEQAAGRPDDVDTRTDVYALGVIAFELLTSGEQPHDTTDLGLHVALRKVVEEQPRRIDGLAPRLRGDVATIVHKALEQERADRYASVDALADDIRRYLRSEPITARPASSWYQIRRFAARHRVVVSAIGLGLLSLLIGVAVAVDRAIEARRSATAEREARVRAERRLGDVREFATRAVFSIHDEIQFLEGATEARRMLMDLGHDALLRLRAEESDDPGLLRAVAEAFVKQGRLRGGGTTHLGEVVEAADCFAEGVRLWRLVVEDPAIEPLPRDRARLGLALYHFAMHALDERDLALAESRLREAARVMRPALEAAPDDQDLPGDLGSVLTRLGRVLKSRGRTEESLALFEEGLGLNAESLRRAETEADRVYQMRGLLVSHNWLGNHFRDLGDLDRAAEEYGRYQAVAQSLHDLAPESEVDQANLAIAHKKISQIAVRRDQLDLALVELRRTFDLLRPLIAETPATEKSVNLRRVFNVVDTAVALAEVHHERGEPLEALRRLESVAEWVAYLRENAGRNAGWRSECDLAQVYRIRALISLRRFTEAQRLIPISEAAFREWPGESIPTAALRAATDLAAWRWRMAWIQEDLTGARIAAKDMSARAEALFAKEGSPGSEARRIGAELFHETSESPGRRAGTLEKVQSLSDREDVSPAVRRLLEGYRAAVRSR